MDYINKMRDMNDWWIPILVFLFFALIGIIIGAINGWKASLYWTSINVFGSLIAIFVTNAFFEDILGPVKKVLENKFSLKISNMNILKGLIILTAIFGLAIPLNFIGLIVYIFVRKKLKNSIKNNKAEGKSNLNSRIIGSGLGLLSVIPSSLLLTSLGTVFSTSKNINKFFSGLTKFSTYGVVENITEDYEGIYALAYSRKSLEVLSEIFKGENLEHINPEKIKKSSKEINLLFENNKTVPLINDFIKNQKGIEKDAKLDEAKVQSIKNSKNGEIAGVLSFLSNKAKKNVITTINKYFKKQGETSDVAQELIDFLTTKKN